MTEPEDDRDDEPTVTVETWVGAKLTSRKTWRREDWSQLPCSKWTRRGLARREDFR